VIVVENPPKFIAKENKDTPVQSGTMLVEKSSMHVRYS
jgi:hypothetical protein